MEFCPQKLNIDKLSCHDYLNIFLVFKIFKFFSNWSGLEIRNFKLPLYLENKSEI